MILGSILLLLGISIILKAIFKIDIPVFRVFLACFFIYMGVKMLFGNFGFHHRTHYSDGKTAVFSDLNAKHEKNERGEYSVVFGDGKIDLSEAVSNEPIEINTVFGDVDVVLNSAKFYSVNANSVFGNIRLPDGDTVSFGSLRTRFPDHAGEPQLRIKANCVFGEIRFIVKAPEEKKSQAGQ